MIGPTATIGEYALAGSLLTGVAVVMATIMQIASGNERLARVVKFCSVLLAGLLTLSSWALLTALLNDNFTLQYVAKHSEKVLETGYKVAAFWAGQEGSLLFWAWLLGLMGLVMTIGGRKADSVQTSVALAVMAAVTAFFCLIMLFEGNPFAINPVRVADGRGLNPLLHNIAMVAHPPLLFLGYAGYTAPFALLIGALVAGKRNSDWLQPARYWIVFSWVMLTVGIVLGSWWAYLELSFGGYWFWDAVENASLLPWFTGTALLHSAVLQARRGIFKRWVATLALLSFWLCIFGTYLTRSGVVQSVHSFGESPIGTYLLVSLIAIALGGAGVIAWRWSHLRPEHNTEELINREGMFLAANVLLVLMMAVTALGTIWPVICRILGRGEVTLQASFYNSVILPMALLLCLIMSSGPILGAGNGALARAWGRLTVMGVIAALAAIAMLVLGLTSPWTIFSAATVAAVLSGVVINIFYAIRVRITSHQDALPLAIVRAFTHNSRHWGAQLAHLGMAAIIVGVVGSAVYGTLDELEIKKGETKIAHGYQLIYGDLQEVRRNNHTAVVATLDIVSPDGKQKFTVKPENRFYDKGMQEGQSAREVDLHMSFARDIYTVLGGWDNTGPIGIAILQFRINPLINWLWIGGALLTLGGLVCLIPTRAALNVPQHEATASDATPARTQKLASK